MSLTNRDRGHHQYTLGDNTDTKSYQTTYNTSNVKIVCRIRPPK
jgi:hypothetical protein